MSRDDFEVIIFKVLTYLYSCLKAGTSANVDKAREVAGCNDAYWRAVVEDMLADGLIAVTALDGWHGKAYLEMRITSKGASYLKENSRMGAVRRFLGRAFDAVIDAAVAATMAL